MAGVHKIKIYIIFLGIYIYRKKKGAKKAC